MRCLLLLCMLLPALSAQGEPRLSPSDARRLFDGETLAGWTPRGGRYDGAAVWTVEDGAIVGRQGPGRKGGLLYTTEEYADFIVSMEVAIDEPFDSGVFVRMVPRERKLRGAQVTLDVRPEGEVGAVYSDGYLQHDETARRHWKSEGWNRVTVRCVGPDQHLTAWVNGVRVTEHRLEPGTDGFARRGLLGIQVHGGPASSADSRARFRRIFLRELPVFDSGHFACDDHGHLTATESGRAHGWLPLFTDGLAGWTTLPDATGFLPRPGGVAIRPGASGALESRRTYGDFEIRFEARLARMANSGLYFRRTDEHPGLEVQILDDHNWEAVSGTTLSPHQFSGGLYHLAGPAETEALRPPGHWNAFVVRVVGSRVTVHLNGRRLHDAVDVDALDGLPGPLPDRGRLHFQRYGSELTEADPYLELRNVFLREL